MAVLMTSGGVLPQRIQVPLEPNTWKNIAEASATGIAPNLWPVGDTKFITIDGNIGSTTFSSLRIQVFILGHNHNSSIEGANKIHFCIGKIDSMDVALCDSKYGTSVTYQSYFNMNTSSSSSGGWASCHMRKNILGSDSSPTSPKANTLLAALPSDLRAVMKPVTKYTDNTGGGSTNSSAVTATTEYLWLPSEHEVIGAVESWFTGANLSEKEYMEQYEYYSLGNSKVKYKHNDLSLVADWFMRSPATGANNAFVAYVSGNKSGGNAYFSQGITPCFAV